MICFATEFSEVYNHIIHEFLLVEELNNELVVKDLLEFILPEYLFEEQTKKCIQTMQELFLWTKDKEYHYMESFHEYILARFLYYMESLQNDDPEEFNELYYSESIKKEIINACILEHEECPEIPAEDLEKYYYDINSYYDCIFEDMDFEMLDLIYKFYIEGKTSIIKRLGINLDYYFELLPKDIQKQYKSDKITIVGEVDNFIHYLYDRIENNNLAHLFTNTDMRNIQIIFDNLLLSFFANRKVDLFWKSKKTKNEFFYEIHKRREKEKVVLLNIKKVNKKELTKDNVDKLLEQSTLYRNTFYIYLCFNDEDYININNHIRKYIYTDTIRLYLNVLVFDLRKKKTASLL